MNKAKVFIMGAMVAFFLVVIRDGNIPAMLTSVMTLALVGGGE